MWRRVRAIISDLDECRAATRWLRPRLWLRRGLMLGNLVALALLGLAVLG